MLTGEGIDVIVHATHEANYKVGGIGAVLDGLLSARSYRKNVRRSVLVGTFDSRDGIGMERLFSARNGLVVIYSSLNGRIAGDRLSDRLQEIERRYRVRIIYGQRPFGSAMHEVLLVDPTDADMAIVNGLKYRLWERFGLQSDRYEGNWEYEHYIRAAEPQYLALEAILGPDAQRRRNVMMAHEFMGVPLCLVAELLRPGSFCRVYYAHEVPPVRPVVESSPGHDTMFYNTLRLAQRHFLTFPQVFGDQQGFFKAALLDMAAEFAAVFAVGDLVVEELRFLGAHFATKAIDLVYNGIVAPPPDAEAKRASRERMRDYAETLTGVRPDYVFTHVTRLVTSKALWRDLRVLEELDPLLAEAGRSAVYFVLATAPPAGRRSEDILAMEAEYGWPAKHRQGEPDLVGAEIPLYEAIEALNARARSVKTVFVNQFGWDRERCGRRMPEGMSFPDIRRGSDLEFGQSIYEPFGIAQVEPLPYGALCLVSSACGCVGFARRAATEGPTNVIVADYISLPPHLATSSWQQALQIGVETRNIVEQYRACEAAQVIMHALPRSDEDRLALMRTGYAQADAMSWEVVVSEYLLPALARALHTTA